MPPSTPARSRAVGFYLLACAACVATMIVVGGLVRLTRSGLSIVEWNPVTGILPPLGEDAWVAELARYRASPEGRMVNAGIDLEGFRRIFLIEWVHRLLGRIAGLVVLLPLVVPGLRRHFSRSLVGKLVVLVVLFAAQGALGWFMVRSGLVDVPHVSPFRLASHLLAAFVLLAALVHLALVELGTFESMDEPVEATRRTFLHRGALGLGALVFVTVGYGALVAGLHAGTLFATFPDYAGAWLPSGAFDGLPAALVSSPLSVLVVHRTLALMVLFASLLLVVVALRSPSPALHRPALALAASVMTQVALGAATVFAHVPLPLASLHQANAVFVVASLVALARASRSAPQRLAGASDATEPLSSFLPKSKAST